MRARKFFNDDQFLTNCKKRKQTQRTPETNHYISPTAFHTMAFLFAMTNTCNNMAESMVDDTEQPHEEVVSTLSLAGGQMLFAVRRIINLDAQEILRVTNHVQHVVHVST